MTNCQIWSIYWQYKSFNTCTSGNHNQKTWLNQFIPNMNSQTKNCMFYNSNLTSPIHTWDKTKQTLYNGKKIISTVVQLLMYMWIVRCCVSYSILLYSATIIVMGRGYLVAVTGSMWPLHGWYAVLLYNYCIIFYRKCDCLNQHCPTSNHNIKILRFTISLLIFTFCFSIQGAQQGWVFTWMLGLGCTPWNFRNISPLSTVPGCQGKTNATFKTDKKKKKWVCGRETSQYNESPICILFCYSSPALLNRWAANSSKNRNKKINNKGNNTK